MAAVPSVPGFVTGEDPSIAKLNQLAYCVLFLNTLQTAGQFTNTGQTVTTSTNTALTLTRVTDRDGAWTSAHPTRYTAQTPGYFQCDAVAAFASNGTGARSAWFQVTTGSGNPGGAGLTQVYGYTAQNPPSGVNRICLTELSPYLYAGDYVEVYAFQSSGGNLATAASAFDIALVSLGP
jgi:hypothetical protein